MAKTAQRRSRGQSRQTGWESFNPAEILTGWWDATVLTAGVLAAPPLRMLGIATPRSKKGELAQAARAFPIVGLGVGLLGGLAYAIAAGLNMPPLIAATIAVSVMAFLGGASNEGGLARFADALIVGGTKTAQLARLKEHALGGYAVLVLVIMLALRIGAISALADPGPATAAMAAAAAASWAAVPAVLHYLPPARRSGFAFNAGRPAGGQAGLAALLGAALAFLFLGPVTGVIALLIGAAGAFKIAWFAQRRLGGATGDVLGSAQQAAEIGVLLAIVALH